MRWHDGVGWEMNWTGRDSVIHGLECSLRPANAYTGVNRTPHYQDPVPSQHSSARICPQDSASHSPVEHSRMTEWKTIEPAFSGSEFIFQAPGVIGDVHQSVSRSSMCLMFHVYRLVRSFFEKQRGDDQICNYLTRWPKGSIYWIWAEPINCRHPEIDRWCIPCIKPVK